MKSKKSAASTPQQQQQPPLTTSINSDNDALTMSYNTTGNATSSSQEGSSSLPVVAAAVSSEEEIAGEEAQKSRKKSSFTSFISPAERKRRKQEKKDVNNEEEEEDDIPQQQEDEASDLPNYPQSSTIKPAADETSEISMTNSEKERVEVVQRTTFISPAERKRRALERQKSLKVETKTLSVSSNIAKFNESFGKKETQRSFNESLTNMADAIVHRKDVAATTDSVEEEKQQLKDSRDSILSADIPPTLSDIEAAVTASPVATTTSTSMGAAQAQDPERIPGVGGGGGEVSSASVSASSSSSSSYPLPKESDREKAKRAAIQAVMRDTSLTPIEKNLRMQQIIRGDFEFDAAAGVTATTAAAAAVGTSHEQVKESPSEEDEEDSSSGEYETTSSEEEEEEEEEEEGEFSSGEYETTSEDETGVEEDGEESSSSEYESRSEEEESTTVVVDSVVKTAFPPPEESLSTDVAEEEKEESTVVDVEASNATPEDNSVEQSATSSTEQKPAAAVAAAAAVGNKQSDLESQLDQELENHQELERQQEQRQAEFRAEQEQQLILQMKKAEAAKALERQEEQRRLLEEEEERLRVEREQQAVEAERRRRLEEEGQRALELVQRRLEQDREKQKALGRQQEEQRQYEQQRRQLEEEQRRLDAEREHQQILERQREQMLLLQEEQRRLDEQRVQLEEEQRRLREDLVREEVQVSRAVGGNVGRTTTTTTTSSTRVAPRSSPNKTISSSLPGGQNSRIPPPRVAPVTSTSQQNTRYDGVDDDELNWRLDSYAMLSDYTIMVRRALPGPHAPDFEVDDANAIDFAMDSGTPKSDVYYVHKAMIAVGSRRSELLGRRIREADSTSRPDGHSSDVNVHETIMLESAADTMGIVLDFLYYPDKPLEMNIHNVVPLVYLGKRYKIRALIEISEEFVHTHLESSNAIHFLLDSYLYQLDDILSRAIDVTAAHLGETLDFNPIYKLPPELFRRIILSKDLNCDSELLSLIVYSYCGEHHAEDIDVEYLRELTKQRLMPDIDSKVALMLLRFYVDLIFADDENCDIMEVLVGDALMHRCIAVAAKHWQGEVYEPLVVDSEWFDPTSPKNNRLPGQEPTAIHRALPTKLQNYLLEKCIIEAKNNFDSERASREAQQGEKRAEVDAVTKSYDGIVSELQSNLKETEKNQNKQALKKHLDELETKMLEMEAELDLQKKKADEYKQELKRFRRVPGIHNFGEVCKKDPTVVDKTKCTYSGNPDHHYPNHRRGDRPPTQMPGMTAEFQNLAKQNGYIYDDGHGNLLPVFYYVKADELGEV